MIIKKSVKNIVRTIVPAKILKKIKFAFNNTIPMNQSHIERERNLEIFYFQRTGKTIDFNNVKTFNEKIQWMKLYYHHKDLSKIVCKYKFKKYIKNKIGEGYTIPIYGKWDNVNDIVWESLPDKFVLKSNASSDGNYIKIVHDKSEVDFEMLKKELLEWLNPENLLINSFCRAYYNVKPCIIAEKYVEQLDEQVYDYKFFCFMGEPKFAYVATDHYPLENQKISLYDLNWNRLEISYGHYPSNNVPVPINLKQMIEISRKLSKDFPFVRVDFFEIESRIYISELTFYPGGGFHEYTPEEVNEVWGDMIVLPKKNVFKRNYFKWI